MGRDNVTAGGDNRLAIIPNLAVNVGIEQRIAGAATVDISAPSLSPWSVTEENGGALVFRYADTPNFYTFFPGSSSEWGCANQVPGLSTRGGVIVLYTGVRWVIREADGVLEFRDMVANTRHAFYPGCGFNDPVSRCVGGSVVDSTTPVTGLGMLGSHMPFAGYVLVSAAIRRDMPS